MWRLVITPSLKKSIRRLYPEYRQAIAAFVEEHRNGVENPYDFSGLEKMEGSKHAYRLRFGDCRLGLLLDKKKHVIELRFAGPRGDFYKHFP